MRRFKILPVLLISLILAQPLYASYDTQGGWESDVALDLSTAFREQYSSGGNLFEPVIPDAAFDDAVADRENRINPEFHVPKGMEGSVGFWLRIYTQYTTQHVVLFDQMHPEIIYDVLDFRDLARTARSQMVYEIVSKKRIQKLVNAYRLGFAKLTKNPHPKKPSREQVNILAAMKKLNHKHSLSELSRNLHAQTGQRDNIVKGLMAADTFLPKMELIFSSMGLPPELTRLSLVESSFNLKAVSRVGATGVWQFMPKSGKEYMMINEKAHIDERLSPLKSTVAAAKLLKRSQTLLHSWALTVTSYNHGYSGIRHLPAAAKTPDHIGKLFSGCSKPRGYKLGWASRNYYEEFLAVLYAESYRHVFYGELPQAASPSIVFYQIEKATTASKLVIDRGVSMYEFRLFNPDVMNLRSPLPRGFWVALPAGKDDFAGLFKHNAHKGRKSIPS